MQKVKIAVIGVGHLGKIHAKLWKNVPNADLIGVYDINQESANAIAKELDCTVFNSINEIAEKCDAVTISSITKTHFKIAQQLIEKGIHCFIEKPITSTYSESKLLLESAIKHKVIVQVGHVERFNPALIPLKDIELKPLFIEVHRLSQFKPRATDVSVIHDLMIHDIDIILWLVNSKVKKIEANGVAIITDTPDLANARITFENGAIANLTASRISATPMRKLRVFQKDAYFSVDFGNQSVEIFKLFDEKPDPEKYPLAVNLGSILEIENPKNIAYQKPEVPKLNAILEEQKSFVESILNNLPIAVTAQEASEAVRIAEIIHKKVRKYNKTILEK
ncbi:MAG: hypothetical protein A2X64_04090 [Ignavibacteria bacterium GWF2_33_9]|nr:MAG: hypothetical protein A2X64_04090 [Ignavibacteria bacterium GWF2_33_9]